MEQNKREKWEEIAKLLFGRHPKQAGFYFTSDCQAFSQEHKNDALNHAKDLADKTVEWVKNPLLKDTGQTPVNRHAGEAKNKKADRE